MGGSPSTDIFMRFSQSLHDMIGLALRRTELKSTERNIAMNIKRLVFGGLLVSAIYPCLSQAPKFHDAARMKIGSGCGKGMDQNTPSGICGPLQVHSNVQHVCLGLPAGLSDKDVILKPSAALTSGSFHPCGDGTVQYAPCDIQWSRFEQTEWYANTHRICGRFKNWSDDRDIVIQIDVTQK